MKLINTFISGFVFASICFGLIYSCDTGTETPPTPPKDNFKLVPVADFIQDVARYNGTHVKEVATGLRSSTNAMNPSRACVYTLDTLRKFMDFIEYYSDQSKVKGRLGIRFFYGVYPMSQSIHGQEYGSLHTLFMVPVFYDSAAQVFIEFDPKSSADSTFANDGIPYPYRIQDIANLRKPGASVFMLDASAVVFNYPIVRFVSDDIIALNQGQLCPPNCPTNSLLEYVDSKYPEGKTYSTNTDVVEDGATAGGVSGTSSGSGGS